MGILNRVPDPPKPIWLGAGTEIIGSPEKGRREIFARLVRAEDGWYIQVEFPGDPTQLPILYSPKEWNDFYAKKVFQPTRMPINGLVGPTWSEVRRETA